MALSQMDPDLTVLAGVRHAQPVATMCVHEALARVHATGEAAIVVYRSGRPVGIATAAALTRAAECGRAAAPIAGVMDYVAVPVSPHADTHEIVRTFTDAAWDWVHTHRA